MLAPDELRRRIDAARTLRGMKQTDLAEKMAQDGLGKYDLGRIERGDERLPFSASHRRSLAHHLRVPEAWFTEPDADTLIHEPAPELEERIDELTREVRALSASRAPDEAARAAARDEILRLLAEGPPRIAARQRPA